ncbi:hypothetical protein VFPPC_17882 [Pochonia chlamydosporia 170]|uniref:Uncharacterized protein n=1 Tax=Pochonia chlamydosporia 170 TaxID=1380566 RepID=A0A219ARU9_METCM|nr:hypothetical protein VFPPC_17882 [Pochonia chlamydosporia 170]OWT42925.1 hypothetical protein VFPPC_17882 [Pochonia chlamydosporia 170]
MPVYYQLLPICENDEPVLGVFVPFYHDDDKGHSGEADLTHEGRSNHEPVPPSSEGDERLLWTGTAILVLSKPEPPAIFGCFVRE